MAQTTFYSNLGPPGDVYNCCEGETMAGSGAGLGEYYYDGNSFTSLASGSISQIDIGVGYVIQGTFFAALYTDNNGVPGTELGQWNNLMSTEQFGDCCGLVSITGITGIDLTAGQSYFLVIGPSENSSTVFAPWNFNSTGATGTEVQTDSGCVSGGGGAGCDWHSYPGSTIGAFDVLGSTGATVPEPSSFVLLGTGLLGIFGAARRKIWR